MNVNLSQYIALGPQLPQFLISSNRMPKMPGAHPPALEISAHAVTAAISLPLEDLDHLTGAVSDTLLCALAEGIGQLLLDCSAPNGTAFAKKQLSVSYPAPPRSRSNNFTVKTMNAIDWQQAGDQDVVIEGRDHADRVLFTAVLTVSVG